MTDIAAAPPVIPVGNRIRIRGLVAACAGNLIEWFDFFVYAYLAIYFAPSFFPSEDQTTQLLSTAAIFAVANAAVEAAHAAFIRGPWASMNASTRGKLLRRLGELIARDAEKLAAIETRDNGKLYAEMSAQLRYIPEWFHYFGGLADKIEGGVPPIDKPEMFVYTKREPLGVVVCITPWNSPLMLQTWKLAPALAAGNTIVIKPSEFTSCSTLALMELVKEAGFPDGVLNTVTGYGAEVGPTLVEHPKVAKIAFTGGDATGAAIYAQAARDIKHVTLELGGKSPNITFDDAKLEDAVKGGRESGLVAIDEYLQTKSVWINLAEGIPNPFVIR